MRNDDQVTSLFLLAFAIFFSIESLRLGMGTLREPGAGFIPFISSVLLGCLSICIFIIATLKKKASPGFGKDWKKGLWVLGGLLIYDLLLERLGFLISTFLFMILALLSFPPRRLASILLVSSLTVIISYLIFGVWLKVQLPKGILGI
ncbi:MAG: hypothetical protein A3G40_01920 [Deltaproteobacteria bacterium RIFCSPLOWO2_12_FULL_57_22]|nr:MAG: hypothetical protein A3G40_01920 [Deltaproteobacteria bacterium RIFCSPLOWO2_12_FULL_57_22]